MRGRVTPLLLSWTYIFFLIYRLTICTRMLFIYFFPSSAKPRWNVSCITETTLSLFFFVIKQRRGWIIFFVEEQIFNITRILSLPCVQLWCVVVIIIPKKKSIKLCLNWKGWKVECPPVYTNALSQKAYNLSIRQSTEVHYNVTL